MVGCDMRRKTITYYDSMSGNGLKFVVCFRHLRVHVLAHPVGKTLPLFDTGCSYTRTIRDYLVQEHADKKGVRVSACQRVAQKAFLHPVGILLAIFKDMRVLTLTYRVSNNYYRILTANLRR